MRFSHLFNSKFAFRLVCQPRIITALIILSAIGFIAIFAPILAPFDLFDSDLTKRLESPSHSHWLGTDMDGRDVLTMMMYGAQTSLTIGVLTVLLSVTVGLVIGLVSGYFGGWVDHVLMRIVDMLMAFPGLLVALVLASVLGPSRLTIIVAISATGWISTARLIRGQVLSLREQTYVTASIALGAHQLRTMYRHILPGTLSPLTIHATFSLSGVIIVESGLSFLGLGAQDGAPSWGALLSQGQSVLTQAPHLSIAPGVAIMLTVLSLNFLGDALRDAMDPRGRSLG